MISEALRKYAKERFESRREVLSPVLPRIEEGFKSCSGDEEALMRFFYGTMPLRDAAEYDFSVFCGYVRHALWLRENVAWCRDLPEEIFVHHVLYYRINSEDIVDCRRFFYEQVRERIEGLSDEKAALELNYWCAEHATYEATDGRTASPVTMFRCGKGRCGEESTFVVTVLRSAGIPARQVYVPRWAHCDDNHAWVEVYLNGDWHFFGACEPEEALDRGWFLGPAGRAVLVHSRTFGDFGLAGSRTAVGEEGILSYWNQTSRYTKTRVLKIRVRDEKGAPVQGAAAAVEILNMAEYYPAASLTTDENGTAEIELGQGCIRVRAVKDGTFAEKAVDIEKEDTVELTLSETEEKLRGELLGQEPAWIRETVRAPKERIVTAGKLTAEQEKAGKERLQAANRLREERFDGILDSKAPEAFPEEAEMLRVAGENAAELYAFLIKDENPDRKKLLHSLGPKDYKDARAKILEDHLSCQRGDLPEEIYVEDLLCPRIWLEELTAYRTFLRGYFSEEEKAAFRQDPAKIWDYVEKKISYDPDGDYDTVSATPIGCLTLGQGSPLSRKILFCAVCRSLDIPARIDPAEMTPQYLKDGVFVTPQVKEEAGGTAGISLLTEEPERWLYFQTWTIGRLADGVYRTLDYYEHDFKKEGFRLTLEPGIYRIIASVRQPGGNQRTAETVFVLEEGQHREIALPALPAETENLTVNRLLGETVLSDGEGNPHSVAGLTADGPAILAFLGIGEEPTEHVLNELLEMKEQWNAGNVRFLAVLRDPAERENRTFNKVLESLLGISLFYGDGAQAARVAEVCETDAQRLPILAAVAGGGAGLYACSGYNVGSIQLIYKILKQNSENA